MSDCVVQCDCGTKAVTKQGHALKTKRLPQGIDVVGKLRYRSHSLRIRAEHIGSPVKKDQLRITAKVVEHRMKILMRQTGSSVHNNYSIITSALSFVREPESVRFEGTVLEARRPNVMIGQKG